MEGLSSTIGAMLHNYAKTNPNQEAIVSYGLRLTFREYDRLTNQYANFLWEKGIKKGDRVAILVGVNGAYPLTLMALAKIGAIAVPINYMWKADRVHWALDHVEAKLIILEDKFYSLVSEYLEEKQISSIMVVAEHKIQNSFLERIKRYPVELPNVDVQPDDPYTILFTSGTSGTPKGVVATQNAYFSNAIIGSAIIDNEFGSRYLMVTPIFHISGVSLCCYHTYLGLTLVFLDEMDPNALIRIIDEEKINLTFLPTPILAVLLPLIQKSDFILPSLRNIISGGSKIPEKTIQAYEELGFDITEIYGLTENTGVVAFWRPKMGYDKIHTIGTTYYYPKIKVLDRETREELLPGEIGELAIYGPQLFTEYWKEPEETEKAFHNGWFLTGEAVRIDKDGFIEQIDRYTDVIYFSGFGRGVYPSIVEKTIRQIPGVIDVSVIGIEHEEFGELPCGFVQIADNATLTKQDVLEYVHGQMDWQNLVEVIIVSEDLPRDKKGKIEKEKLKEIYYKKTNEKK